MKHTTPRPKIEVYWSRASTAYCSCRTGFRILWSPKSDPSSMFLPNIRPRLFHFLCWNHKYMSNERFYFYFYFFGEEFSGEFGGEYNEQTFGYSTSCNGCYIDNKRPQKPTLGCLFEPLIRKLSNFFETFFFKPLKYFVSPSPSRLPVGSWNRFLKWDAVVQLTISW